MENYNSIKPLARLSEKYADSEQWVTCKAHFGVHRERVTCESPKSDDTSLVDGKQQGGVSSPSPKIKNEAK